LGQPCNLTITPVGPTPEIEITEATGLHILTTLDLDIKCKRKSSDTIMW